MQFRQFMSFDMVVKRDDTGMGIRRNNWNAARHGESAQQQQTWNKLHFK
jgi:hypothetical protein